MYLVDANILINAKNTYYPFSLVPGFWTWFKQEAVDGKIFSIVQVKAELMKGDDQLAHWVRTLPPGFWLKDTPTSTMALGELATWASSQSFSSAAIQTFFSSADYRLAAHAKATGYTVVTNEKPEPLRKKEIKLPDACVGVLAHSVDPFSWMRKEATRFAAFGCE